MPRIRIAWGSGVAPTEMAAYDAALADANVHNYNLIRVSSVIPADATVSAVDTAPDLGPAGNTLTVVEARGQTAGPGQASAGLAWAPRDGAPGLFYEAADETTPDDVADRVTTGITAGMEVRDWDDVEPSVRTETVTADAGEHAAAVVIAAYGDSDPVFDQ
ncbi:pyruvoyl-dependent arginine decarboxylase [Halobacterium salinarum]|uniref:pyruvoyl-dependent arginine decarboxylase n=1 Tax=Halobacterium salinarum TaxID=2242 RepID=UPI001F1E17F1|nr:pyruvoyl-dependent arginine decarboxylase [Halobacterium salinarum]MCF2166238.1 pyruvoyl-dependent arginine decarboxylase subunit alpha [Halobacterium salinarum]MCF2167721.1 pyruvoyl-dependent arginine decarboxylase subunit alpha [Halobacterium salinarum]